MKLYYSLGACSHASHIILHELGIPFEIEKVNLMEKKTATGTDFFAINPKGYVPALQLDNGTVITESGAVLPYLGSLQNGERTLLAPEGQIEHYITLEWLIFTSTEIHQTYIPFFNPKTPEEYKEVALEKLHKRLAYLDAHLANREFIATDNFTIADAYTYVITGGAGHVTDTTQYTNIAAYRARIAQRDTVKKATAAEAK